MSQIRYLAVALALLPLAAGIADAGMQAAGTTAAASEPTSLLSAVDYNFIAQANLGAPFQIDSGRLAESKALSSNLRDYAHLMVVSHIPVVNALNTILQHKGITAPSEPLLHGAYDAILASLKAEHGAAFDRDYVNGQVEYQKGNAALFRNEIQNGSDPDLKQFARQTLPKIEDHLQRALKLAQDGKHAGSASKPHKPS